MGRRAETMIGVLKSLVLICACSLILPGTACAEDTKQIVPRHTFALGAGVSYFDYVEDLPPHDVEVDGPMYGVVGSYTYHDKIMIQTSLDYSMGDLDYEGGWMITGTPSKTDEESWIVECRGLIGYDYRFGGKHMVSPFVGIGYRYRNTDLKGFGGFEREEAYWYSPIGIRSYGPLSDTWNWGMSLEYDIFWDGETDYDVPGSPTINIDSGYGARFSLRFGRQLTEDVALSMEPYITYWDIDETDWTAWPESGGWLREPDNETTTYGLRVSVEF